MVVFMKLPEGVQFLYFKEKNIILIHFRYCLEHHERRCPLSLENASVVCSDDDRRPESCPNREVDFERAFRPGFREFWGNVLREVSLT